MAHDKHIKSDHTVLDRIRVSNSLSTMLQLDENMRRRILDFCLKMETFLSNRSKTERIVGDMLVNMGQVRESDLFPGRRKPQDLDFEMDDSASTRAQGYATEAGASGRTKQTSRREIHSSYIYR